MNNNSYSMEVAFTRDAYGRIISKTSDGSVPVTQTFTYNMRNLLETATDTVGNAATSVTRFYDSFGNPYSEAVSANNITKTVSRRMTDAKTYQFTYPDGKILRKTATGNDLDLIEYGTTGNLAEIAAYSRANGVLTAVTKGQNLTETFSYNNWNLLDNHTVSNAPNSDIYDMTYGYSRGWHLIEKADGIIIGFFGTFLGALAGTIICMILSDMPVKVAQDVYYIEKIPVDMSPLTFVVAIFGSLILTVIAAVYPGKKAAKLSPAEALRQD